jgi:SNF2 family DNA or RNA helicase
MKQHLVDIEVELRQYQIEMLEHLIEYPHVATFDEMGIGKTVECIAMDAYRRRSSGIDGFKTLVVAPLTGVIDQWIKEFNKFNPSLKVRRIDAKKRYLLMKEEADVYVIHPEGLRLMIDELSKYEWHHFIFDEVHKIKNRKTKTFKAAKALGKQVMFKTGASGTPIENRPEEAWAIFNWLYPDNKSREAVGLAHWTKKLLNSYWRFFTEYTDYYEDPEYGYIKILGAKNTDDFKVRFGPFYIRRLKREVLDLPPKVYQTYEVDLLPKQRRAYDEMKRELVAWVGQNEDQPVIAPIAIAQMIRLQQFTLGYGELETVTRHKQDGSTEQVTSLKLNEPSVKLDALIDIISDLGDSQAIVFSTSKQAINMAQERLEKAGYDVSKVTGDVTDAKRTIAIRKFQEGESQVLVSTIRAGGVGMNLQNASVVIFLDRDWSPAKNQQAEDRSHRSGQENPVTIIDIQARNTIDQKKHTTLERKWGWIKAMVGA